MEELQTINLDNSSQLPALAELQFNEEEANQIAGELQQLEKTLIYKLFLYAHELDQAIFTNLIIESDKESLDGKMKGEVRAIKRSKLFFTQLHEMVSEKLNKNQGE